MLKLEKEFDYIKVKLASPSRIKQWGQRKLPHGQKIGNMLNADTINYRTYKPEMGGLFCERIFGPNKSFECPCGKYKQIRFEGFICDRCGVELTHSNVRRHRMGHIQLIYPVSHVWYINSRPNYMALLLEVEQCEQRFNTVKIRKKKAEIVALRDEKIQKLKLSSLAYFIGNEVSDLFDLHWDLRNYRIARRRGRTSYTEKPYNKPTRPVPSNLVGSALIKKELELLNLASEIAISRKYMKIHTYLLGKSPYLGMCTHWSKKWEWQRIYKLRSQTVKRIRILENLLATRSNPAWMIISILPVIPPALRPMIQLESGRFATSDLNELYKRVITRNNRLLRLLEINAPQLIIRNEKRMLQEAVDTLIDNGKRGKLILGTNNRPLKSLSDIIKGKYGRFRLNLLGKRVDYSGRSVIVVGPNLKLNQCGLPYEMATELFQPFIIRKLINRGLTSTIKMAKIFIQHNRPLVEPVLQEVVSNFPLFLNRAPTLHRLGIQAFEPIIIKGRAIKLHPLVCSAFNADFDGDQMAVHIPLSVKAQAECYILMLSPYNFLSPSNGEPIIVPSQDMVLGCYYLTVNNISGLLGSNNYFSDLEDVILAYHQEQLELHSSIWVRLKIEIDDIGDCKKKVKLADNSYIEYYDNLQIRKDSVGKIIVKYLRTTTGRVIFNYTIQKTLNLL
jgi:DNA-directed RNA polymerase subunit beta'|tara:strand:+ start:35675 stop:37696 length:2022 start_codon:yes stop_codon:yes gene_type:complete